MAGKDQAIGALIFLVCMVLITGYIVALIFTEPVVNGLNSIFGTEWAVVRLGVRYWLVAVPVVIAFVVVLAIGAWIGWTMATTPPPKPLEEIETEEKGEEEKPAEEAEEEKEA